MKGYNTFELAIANSKVSNYSRRKNEYCYGGSSYKNYETGIVGEIVNAFPATLGTLLNIARTRNLFWLRDELRVIGLAA